MINQRQPTMFAVLGALSLALVLSACGQPAAPPLPTRTPMPTFTPTPQDAQAPTPDANVAATTQAAAALATQQAEQAAQATQAAQSAPPTNTTAPPTPTPPANPEVVANDQINVRQGPGTNYNIVGAVAKGERFKATGKNQDGSWWQIDYKGQPGWLFSQLVTPQNTGAVAVAQNIPAPPPPTNTPPPPPPTNTPPPAAPPKPKYKFNIAVVGKCERQPAGNWFEGRTYVNGKPESGYYVAFSYASDGPIVAKIISGPHQGYPGWNVGFYSHIINSTNPQAATWFVWVVDDKDQRISEIASWTSTGPGEGCNQAVVDFDSRP